MSQACCSYEVYCQNHPACASAFNCFTACMLSGGASGSTCAAVCMHQPPTQGENALYTCAAQKCGATCY
jgi:hypothetical protein